VNRVWIRLAVMTIATLVGGCKGEECSTCPSPSTSPPFKEGTWRFRTTSDVLSGDCETSGPECYEEYLGPGCDEPVVGCQGVAANGEITLNCTIEIPTPDCGTVRTTFEGAGSYTETSVDVTILVTSTSGCAPCVASDHIQGEWVRSEGACGDYADCTGVLGSGSPYQLAVQDHARALLRDTMRRARLFDASSVAIP
jgi:hypothetical protein